MSKQDVIDYVMHTPYNANEAVLRSLLEDLGGGGVEMPAFKVPLDKIGEPVSITTAMANSILSAGEGDLFELDGVDGIGVLQSITGPEHDYYDEDVEADYYDITFAIINDGNFGYVNCSMAITETQEKFFISDGFEPAGDTPSDLLPIMYGTINQERLHMVGLDYVITLDGSFSLEPLPTGFLYLTKEDNHYCGLGFSGSRCIIEDGIYEITNIDTQTRQITCSFYKMANKTIYLYKTIFDNQTNYNITATVLSNYNGEPLRVSTTISQNQRQTLETDVTMQPYWIGLRSQIPTQHFNCTSSNSYITVYKKENSDNNNDNFIIEVSPIEENDIPVITISVQS